jgi:hypothetical protein
MLDSVQYGRVEIECKIVYSFSSILYIIIHSIPTRPYCTISYIICLAFDTIHYLTFYPLSSILFTILHYSAQYRMVGMECMIVYSMEE